MPRSPVHEREVISQEEYHAGLKAQQMGGQDVQHEDFTDDLGTPTDQEAADLYANGMHDEALGLKMAKQGSEGTDAHADAMYNAAVQAQREAEGDLANQPRSTEHLLGSLEND